MYIVFPSDPLNPAQPDADYQIEVTAAQAAGFAKTVFDLDALRVGDRRTAFKRTMPAPAPSTPLLYRGWMVRDTEYALLYAQLVARGYQP